MLRVSSDSSANTIAKWQSTGHRIFGEVEASSIGVVGNPRDYRMVVSPPLRSNPETSNQLLEYLAS